MNQRDGDMPEKGTSTMRGRAQGWEGAVLCAVELEPCCDAREDACDDGHVGGEVKVRQQRGRGSAQHEHALQQRAPPPELRQLLLVLADPGPHTEPDVQLRLRRAHRVQHSTCVAHAHTVFSTMIYDANLEGIGMVVSDLADADAGGGARVALRLELPVLEDACRVALVIGSFSDVAGGDDALPHLSCHFSQDPLHSASASVSMSVS
eukprot:1481645-Rhodomonas_salina.1